MGWHHADHRQQQRSKDGHDHCRHETRRPVHHRWSNLGRGRGECESNHRKGCCVCGPNAHRQAVSPNHRRARQNPLLHRNRRRRHGLVQYRGERPLRHRRELCEGHNRQRRYHQPQPVSDKSWHNPDQRRLFLRQVSGQCEPHPHPRVREVFHHRRPR